MTKQTNKNHEEFSRSCQKTLFRQKLPRQTGGRGETFLHPGVRAYRSFGSELSAMEDHRGQGTRPSHCSLLHLCPGMAPASAGDPGDLRES